MKDAIGTSALWLVRVSAGGERDEARWAWGENVGGA